MSISNYTVTISDFENMRLALMDSYNTQALQHAGYIIAILVAVAALFSSDFVKNFSCAGGWRRLFVYAIVSVCAGSIFYFITKVIFWSWFGSETLVVPMADAVSKNTPTVIYGLQAVIMQKFLETSYWMANVTFSPIYGFNVLSYVVYFGLPLAFSLIGCFIFEKVVLKRLPKEVH